MRSGAWLRPEVQELPTLPAWGRFGGIPGPQWTLGIALLFRSITLLAVLIAPPGGQRLGMDRPIAGVVSLCLGLALLNRRWIAPTWFLHLNITAWMLTLSWFMATAVNQLSIPLNLFGVIAIAVYVGAWFPSRQALVHAAVGASSSFLGLMAFGQVRELLSVWLGAMLVGALGSLLVHTLTRHVQHLANTDQLTGLLNRNGLAVIVDRAGVVDRLGAPLSLVVLDLDRFKAVNDEQGHLAGDALLRQVAASLRGNVRASDIVARTGGDEFLLLLPRTSVADADLVVQRLAADLPIGSTYGCALWLPDGSFDDAVARADRMMYERKSSKPN